MREKLYLPLEKRSLRYAYYMYLDVKPYLADQLFIRHKVRVWFDGEYVKDGFPYTMILCHVRKNGRPPGGKRESAGRSEAQHDHLRLQRL